MSENSEITFVIKSSLFSLNKFGERDPPTKRVKEALSFDARFGKIVEVQVAPKNDFFSLEGIRNPKPSNGFPMFSFLYPKYKTITGG